MHVKRPPHQSMHAAQCRVLLRFTLCTFDHRFDVDGSLSIDDANAAAEHAQVQCIRAAASIPPYLATLRGEEMPHECISSHARKLLAADLQDDSLYPELHISVKLPYQIHEIFLDITMPRLYPSAEALRARVRSETMPSAAIGVTTMVFVCPRPPACCSSCGDVL